MNLSQVRNPFDYANPVSEPHLFAGRGRELGQIDYLLEQTDRDRPVGYIALHGERAAGKTSLLNMTELLARRRSRLTVRIQLSPGDDDPAAFFRKFYEELIGAVAGEAGLTAPDGRPVTSRLVRRLFDGAERDPDFPLEFPESLAQSGRVSEMALRADLELLTARLGRSVAVLIDEAQILAGREDVLSVLRSLGMRLRGYLFVLAGTSELLPGIQRVFAPILRQFVMVKVERFSEGAEVQHCLAKPLAALGLELHDCFAHPHTAVADLLRLTDGNPYEIQLYGYVMFSRWQTGVTGQMELTTETLEEVRSLLEAGSEAGRHSPVVAALRGMSAKRLWVFNALCSSLDGAGVDELWLAHSLAAPPPVTRDEFDRFHQEFLAEGLLETRDGAVRLGGGAGMFEEIYTRLWTLSRPDRPAHPPLLSRLSAELQLSRQLENLLRDILPPDARLLRTCCLGMAPEHLEEGLSALDSLAVEDGRPPSFTVAFLHAAILRCGMPSALDLTTLTCTFGGVTAVRWAVAADSAEFEAGAHPGFLAAQRRVRALGGELLAERTRQPLKPWRRIIDWLVAVATDDMRKEMAQAHDSAVYTAYAAGDLPAAEEHLRTAFQLAPAWHSANNLGYVMLRDGRAGEALEWAERALDQAGMPVDRALSRFNAAMAEVLGGDLAAARERLALAREELSAVPDIGHHCAYLLVPRFRDGELTLHEVADPDLGEKIAEAAELVELAERYRRLQGAGPGPDRS
ncbi:ATP-binding protein [Streptomyces aidingensis]|uniref:AAA ATPase domain-containing protein n=1 Tax=Streptomyces aidingensis TaxID=910347 RepID=A0A1I1QWQ1_9ACTN|nr:tetratricopeptide repeat protein [Streptomyces aidingensis]SFD26417.1 AAA ATPase domain-containing protein [Streptomyces aidingensis]